MGCRDGSTLVYNILNVRKAGKITSNHTTGKRCGGYNTELSKMLLLIQDYEREGALTVASGKFSGSSSGARYWAFVIIPGRGS